MSFGAEPPAVRWRKALAKGTEARWSRLLKVEKLSEVLVHPDHFLAVDVPATASGRRQLVALPVGADAGTADQPFFWVCFRSYLMQGVTPLIFMGQEKLRKVLTSAPSGLGVVSRPSPEHPAMTRMRRFRSSPRPRRSTSNRALAPEIVIPAASLNERLTDGSFYSGASPARQRLPVRAVRRLLLGRTGRTARENFCFRQCRGSAPATAAAVHPVSRRRDYGARAGRR